MGVKIKITARNCALNLLARREHSKAELQKKLLAREFLREEVEEVTAALQSENLQSDERFAEAYINMRANRGFGPARISRELQERGVNDNLISEYLSNIDWQAKAKDVWQKKFRSKYPKDFAERAKQMAFLQYRGFITEQIQVLFTMIYEN